MRFLHDCSVRADPAGGAPLLGRRSSTVVIPSIDRAPGANAGKMRAQKEIEKATATDLRACFYCEIAKAPSAHRLADLPVELVLVENDEPAKLRRLSVDEIVDVVDDVAEAAFLANRFLQQAQQRRIGFTGLGRVVGSIAQQSGVRVAAPVRSRHTGVWRPR